ncbi:hypothetical protein MRX96_020858 [Rhipicephalus microplus]
MLPPVTRAERMWCRTDGDSHRSVVAYLTWSSGDGLVQRTRRLLIGEAPHHSVERTTIGEDSSAATGDERPSVSTTTAVHSLH